MILIIDNYDSFTFNLVQAFGALRTGHDIRVVRNDRTTPEEVESWGPDFLVISPGPCTPDQSGVSMELIRRFAGRIPILGVCLGHQCIAQAFGGGVIRAARLMHGKTSEVFHHGEELYAGLPSPFEAMRYHSLIVDRESLPRDFEVTSWTAQGELMGIRHREGPIEGVQFHPESFMTPQGERFLQNFLMPTSGSHVTNHAGDAQKTRERCGKF